MVNLIDSEKYYVKNEFCLFNRLPVTLSKMDYQVIESIFIEGLRKNYDRILNEYDEVLTVDKIYVERYRDGIYIKLKGYRTQLTRFLYDDLSDGYKPLKYRGGKQMIEEAIYIRYGELFVDVKDVKML